MVKPVVSKLLACNYEKVEYSDIPFHRSFPLKFPCRINNLERETNYEYHESRWHSLLILFIKAWKLFSNKNSSSDTFPREKEDILQASSRYETFIQALLIKSRFSFLARERTGVNLKPEDKNEKNFSSPGAAHTHCWQAHSVQPREGKFSEKLISIWMEAYRRTTTRWYTNSRIYSIVRQHHNEMFDKMERLLCTLAVNPRLYKRMIKFRLRFTSKGVSL